MKHIFRGFLLLVAILLIQLTLLPPNEALSENEGLVLKEMNIKVMPEFINPEEWDFNKPSLLVGFHGTFINESDTAYSGEIKVKVPTHLPEFRPGFVAQFLNEEDAEPIPADYTVHAQEGYFTWTPENPIQPNEPYYFVLEYFSASIEGVVDRSFTFEYVPQSNIDNVNLAVYAPFRSVNFEIDKEAELSSMQFGIQFFMYEYSDVKQGEIIDLNVSYTKQDIVTTMEALNDFSAPDDDVHAGFNSGTGQQNQTNGNVENIIMVALIILISGAFIFFILIKKKSQPVKKEKANKPKRIVNKEEEIKKLRKLLAEGKIDEKSYKEQRAKLG